MKRLLLSILLLGLAASVQAAPSAVRPQQDSTRFSSSIPFDFYRHEVILQVTIDGAGPYPMFLDTGTNPSIIDLSLARHLGLPVTAVGRGGSGGGSEKNLVYETCLPTVGVGGLAAPNIDALALDLSELSRHFGRPVRGVLGDSLMSGCIVLFDYPARRVRFLSSIPPPGAATRTVLSFHHGEGVETGSVRIDGRPARANIDTGSNSAFQITPRAVRRLGLSAQARHARPASGAGFNGKFTSRVGTVDSVTVGTFRVTRPEVTFWLPGTGHDDSPWDVNIGNLFLQHYRVIIDYAHDTLILDKPGTPPEHALASPKKTSGGRRHQYPCGRGRRRNGAHACRFRERPRHDTAFAAPRRRSHPA